MLSSFESEDRAQIVRKCSNTVCLMLMNKQLDANIEADLLDLLGSLAVEERVVGLDPPT